MFKRRTYSCLNPLKRVNSILTTCYRRTNDGLESLNPLKRVNSILTAAFSSDCGAKCCKVKKDSDGKRWVEGVGGIFFDLI